MQLSVLLFTEPVRFFARHTFVRALCNASATEPFRALFAQYVNLDTVANRSHWYPNVPLMKPPHLHFRAFLS